MPVVGEALMIKIGSYAWIVLCLFSTRASGAPFLRLVLPSGEIVSHVAAQQPVILELVSDQPIKRVPPHASFASFVTQTSEASLYKSNNGIASREYIHRWHLVFPKPQVVTVGPLVVPTDSGTHRIPELTITVVPPHDHSPKAQIEYDSRSVVIGEWCSADIVFTIPAGAPCSDLICPVPDSIALRVDQPSRSRIVRSGKPMDEIRYRIHWMAKNSGSFTLGPATLSYAMQPQGMFGFLGRFAAEQIRLATDTISLIVDPLPPHEGPVHAVGDIQKIFIKTAHTQCMRGAGISVDLCIIGPCTLLADPAMLMPSTEEYAVYASHQEQVPGAVRSVYTVKPERDGTLICSMPDFTFFNTRTRQYETICGEPLTLHVTASHPPVSPTAAIPANSHDSASGSFAWWHISMLLLLGAFLAMIIPFCVRPFIILSRMQHASDAEECARLYGELCMLFTQSSDPYQAAQKIVNAGNPPLGPDVARWYLEQRYAHNADWEICRDAAQRISALRLGMVYASARISKKIALILVVLCALLAIYRIGTRCASYERCMVAQGTPLYYLPKKDPALCVGSIAADSEAVIIEKRDQWIFIRCAVQRGWVDCSESATPGG